ncbi:MAG TPA: aldolase/citrate lyase family protein [Candidatus Acidoferrum sp.]|jgi:4-hydroxy-2-oxoheptanedioate aldolase|nr:aldolase/citrate lyase family protein [Candidatus Acidoferrum sp.]
MSDRTAAAPVPFVPDFHELLAPGKFSIGTWLTILDPAATELIAGAGFDLLVADGEHGAVATSDLVSMLIATRASGVPLLYRVAANEPVRIMHALDAGASGVVIPQVRTTADVERAVAWCRYPPSGLRGIAPRRAGGYGRGTGAYMAAANALVTCCIQIETREALESLDTILSVPGIDTILVGPNDLAASLGHTGDIGHEEIETAFATIIDRANAHGIRAGAWAGSAAQARYRRDQGYAWATVGADYAFMVSAADAAAREVKAG